MEETKDKKVYLRMQVIAMRGEGKTNAEIAETTGYALNYISKIVTRFFHNGFAILLGDKRSGNNQKVNDWQTGKFLKKWKKRAEAGKIISTNEMRLDFQKQYNISITPQAFRRLLKRHGWRKIEPRKQHIRVADAKTIKASKKLNVKLEKSESASTRAEEKEKFESCFRMKQALVE
jgi:transposase